MKINFFKTKKEPIRLKLIKELNERQPYEHGYSILRSSTTLKEENEYIVNLAKQYDELGYMTQTLGEELDGLFADENYIIGIHRTGYTSMSKEIIDDIFNRGLINNGHIMQGGMSGNFDIEKTVTLFNDFTVFNGQLKIAKNYKGSEGCVIVKIPKSYLGKGDGDIQPIYYKDGNINRLLPEFIYGYIPVLDKEGLVGNIERNPNYRDKHYLKNPNLFYDEGAFYKEKREGIALKQQDISIEDKYQIIEKAYQETLIKYGNYQAEQALLRLINDNEVRYFTGSDNKMLLSKYVIYGDVLKVLSSVLPNMEKADINTIINNFTSSSNFLDNVNNKSK